MDRIGCLVEAAALGPLEMLFVNVTVTVSNSTLKSNVRDTNCLYHVDNGWSQLLVNMLDSVQDLLLRLHVKVSGLVASSRVSHKLAESIQHAQVGQVMLVNFTFERIKSLLEKKESN